MRNLTSKTVAEALGVSERSVRLYAQAGRIPFTVTPGGHRRFDLDEVRDALSSEHVPHDAPTLVGVRRQRRKILAVAHRHGASNVRVFGSVANGTADEGSDIDLLVSLDRGRTYADVDALEAELADTLGVDVDVLTEGACHGRFAHVIDEAVPL